MKATVGQGKTPVVTKLKAARAARGWSQAELAYHARMWANDISRYENLVAAPSPAKAGKLAELLGLSPSELLEPAEATEAPTAQSLVERALASACIRAQFSSAQVHTVCAQLRAAVAALPPELRTTGTFVRYVQMREAIASLLGADNPGYAAWRQAVAPLIAGWTDGRVIGPRIPDEQIVPLLYVRAADDPPAVEGAA